MSSSEECCWRFALARRVSYRLSARGVRLVWAHVIDGLVLRQEGSCGQAADAADDGADSGWQGFAADIQAKGLRTASFVQSSTYACSDAGAGCADDERVAEAVFVLHQLDGADVGLLQVLLAGGLGECDGRV